MKLINLSIILLLCSCIRPGNAKNKAKIVQGMAASIQKQFADVAVIEAHEAIKLTAQKDSRTVLVDVREQKERNVSIIPGAISKAEFENRHLEFKNYQVIPYCTIGYRSSEYVRILTQRGFKAYNLKGSILSWIHAGGTLIDKSGPTKKVHVFGEAWNFAPNDYQAIYDN
ncbi:MAG: rhodanese-like domain-containing protein [Halobacteriovoraceae bacterium]|nr:rhodanese-like domain-containing protein [Halobacteriovoraceae bacterium]